MVATERTGGLGWTRERTALLALLCLIAGTGGGWFLRGGRSPVEADSARTAGVSVPASSPASAAAASSSPDRGSSLETQAAPLLARLKTDPNNPASLISLGNLYYDAKQYSTAVGFYQRALKANPADASVRTDLGTAYWYMGNADAAITEFDTALSFVPNNPNTLFNRGLIKWQGKQDRAGAVADWQKLLATDPNYAGKDQVIQLLSDVTAQQLSK